MISDFILKLISNPNFNGQPISMIEQQVSNFVEQNKQQMSAIASQKFYPGLSGEKATEKLIADIRTFISQTIIDKARQVVPSSIDIPTLPASLGIGSGEAVLASTLMLYEKIAAHREARQMIDQYCILLDEHYIDRYVGAAYQEKGYIFNELFRVQKLNLDLPNMCEYLKLCAAVAPATAVKISMPQVGAQPVNAYDLKDRPAQQKMYFDKITQLVRSIAPEINDELLSAALKIPVAAEEIHASPVGKFLAILFARARDFRKGQRAEKGSETPDKSWFSVQVKNASFMGFDKRMLEEFNRHAFTMKA
ncbi:MAG: hypothetical protein OHK0011_23030 [Turneriella sp.]